MNTFTDCSSMPGQTLPSRAFHNFYTRFPRSLEQAVHKAVCDEHDEAIKPVAPDEGGPVSLTRAMLALLTFCYARQVYRSGDLHDVAKRDTDFTRLNGADVPNTRTIRRFREKNREPLRRCLIAALKFLAETKISLGALTRISEAQLAEEASRRITMAAFLDAMEQDGEPANDPPAEFSYLIANLRRPGH